MDELIKQLLGQTRTARPAQRIQIIQHVAGAPFAEELLEADEPLWGSFWQGDVIAPGYQLPAVELALLRAVRLDAHWPEGIAVAQFLADLRAAATHPQAEVQLRTVAGEPGVCLASPDRGGLITVVWYCASTGQLHAGYRRGPGAPPAWLRRAIEQPLPPNTSTAARLDREILKLRLAD